MSGGSAAVLHEGGTTSAVAPYLYYTGNALSRHFDCVYLIRGGWAPLCGTEMLEEGIHYHDFSKVNIDPSGRANPAGTDRKCPVATPKHPDANYSDRVIEHLKRLGVGVVAEKGGDDGKYIVAMLRGPLEREGISIIPEPKTIDADLYTGTSFGEGLVSDTPGFRSAVDNISGIAGLGSLRYEAADTNRVFTVGVMGRKCGQLALAVAYRIGADFCIIPEIEMDQKRIDRLMGNVKPGDVVVVSEGATWWNRQEGKCTGFYVYRRDETGDVVPVLDTHGRKKLGSAQEGVAEAIENATGITARSQDTGYFGRSGPPSEGDIEYEEALGEKVDRLVSDSRFWVMPAPARIVPYFDLRDSLHEVELPPAESGYDGFKRRMVQPFGTDRFFDEETFRWTPDFEALIDTMLRGE